MLHFLLKRLLLTLPALWVLATFVFLLSRLLPGPSGAEQILQENGGFYSKGSKESRENAYRSYLHRTGQDLPLFYFSVKAGTEPDTLNLVYPESERVLLQRLSWHYGNWPRVDAYYKSLKNVEQALLLTPNSAAHKTLAPLYTSTTSESILQNLTKLAEAVEGTNAGEEVLQLKEATAELVNKQENFAFLLPSFQWHGTRNQYHSWLIALVAGNAGTSYRDMRPVQEVILEAIGNTIWLILISITISFLISLELSILFVMRKGRIFKGALLPALFVLDSIPLFLLALLLLVLFASPAFLQWFPVFGMGFSSVTSSTSWFSQLSIQLQYMALPALCLILVNIPFLTNLIYRAISEEKKADYARTAKAKGLGEALVIRRHVLRNSLLPIITILTEALPALLAGTVVIETIFAIPGLGRLLISSVMSRDYPVIVAIVLVVALIRVLAYLLADIGYGLADPRIRQRNT